MEETGTSRKKTIKVPQTNDKQYHIRLNTTKDLCTPKLCTLVSSMQTLLNDWLKHANDGLFINSVEFSK
jgi:hypothetical protein